MRTVAGLFVQKEDRVLLVFKKGYWFFPGGKLELGETSEDALIRELQEELHLVCQKPNIRPIYSGAHVSPDGEMFRFDTFTCAHNALVGIPKLNPRDTVKDWGWIDRPLELNLTEHARFILGREAGAEWAA